MMNDDEIYFQQLVLERLAGVISDEDNALLIKLIEENKDYKKLYNELNERFDNGHLKKILNPDTTNSAWANVQSRVLKTQKTKSVFRHIRMAAAIIVPLMLLTTWWVLHNSPNKINKVVANNKVHLLLNNGNTILLDATVKKSDSLVNGNVKLNIAKGRLSYSVHANNADNRLNTLVVPLTQTYEITLTDGTVVWLNSLSSLKFPFVFSGASRDVYLSGEAYFKVKKDGNHPFIVHTSLTTIKDLGTEFNVNTYDSSSINTSLVEGSVITTAKDGSSKELIPGNQALFRTNEGFTVSRFDKEKILSWRDGIYYFDHTPLKDISPVIFRWFGKTMVMDNASISDYVFTGALFKNKSLSEFLNNLSATSEITYKIDNGNVRLSKALSK